MPEVLENLLAGGLLIQNVNLNALRVFAIAAQQGNFQRAADVLGISHGAVSQRIKQLEVDLGTVLFDRQSRGVSLTRVGESYRNAVDEALAILSSATADLEGTRRQITIHVGPSTASKWLMPRLADFNACHPETSLATEVHENLLVRNLGRNELAIWPGKEPDGNPSNETRHLAELELVAVCSPEFTLPTGDLDVEVLVSLPLLQDSHRRWEKLNAETGIRPRNGILNFGSSALALDAAIKGHGIAIAPTFMIENDIQLGKLVKIWRSPLRSGENLYLSWAKKHSYEKPLRQTIRWVLGEFGLDNDLTTSSDESDRA